VQPVPWKRTVINGHCELLAETLDAASPQQADLTEIRRAGERATSLTQQLLAFSRRQILAPRVLDLSDSLNAIEPDAQAPEGVRRLAERILGQRGYCVLAATTPRLALEIAASHEGRIDLLLPDVVMPEISGKLLAEQLIAARPSLRVLYMSGYTDNAIVHHGVVEPDTPFVQKPFPPVTLLRKVWELLDS